MRTKEIFFVVRKLGGKGWGGAHRVIAVLANYFSKKKYDVTIIVWQNTAIDYPLNPSIKIQWLQEHGVHKSSDFKFCLKTRDILKNHRGAYVFVFMSRMASYAVLYTTFLGVKLIGSERTDPKAEPKKRIFRILRNIAFCYLDRIVFQTHDAKSYFPKKAQKKGVVIPNPLSPNLPEPYKGKRKKEFVTFCRIDRQKNLHMMIDAFIKLHEIYPDYCLRIYGTGILEDEIKEYILKLNAREFIFMEGFNKDVHSLIRESFAYLSTSDYEGLSNSMIEALAIGLPCICTDCPSGGAKMIIKHGENGLLIPVGDTSALINEMKVLIENPELAVKISKNAVGIRTKLQEGVICKQWENLIS